MLPIATDPGNDTTTYTWNFGDATDAVIAQHVNHIFADNGIYTVTLTVSDSDGANTSSTLITNVGNVAPIVSSGVNQTIYTTESVSFDSRFTDPGILDTHTITWDFGDGNTTTGILNPSHVYTTDGTYTATLTVTDNDNAVSNDTMTVTVKKPPSISVSDVTIIEGDNGQKLAIFTASLSEVSSRNISVNYITADGTATAGSDYTATNGTITFATGETTKTIAVEVIGDTIDEFDETFFLKLDNAINATITTTSGVGTIVDNDSAPTLAISDRTITEGDNSTTVATFTVNVSTASAKLVTVNYTTADGTAISGSDYTSTNGTLTFAPFETSKSISVQVLGDTLDEFDETFNINLSNATNATIANTQAVGTIVDNDSAPTLAISDRTITEGDNGTTVASFTVSLSDKSAKPITVKYTTADGTAIALDDYTATNGTISFAPGEISKTISVQVMGDAINEFDETFFLNLSDATNATIAKNQAVATILDDDASPTLTISDRSITEGDNGTATITYTVNLSTPSAKPIGVKYATADGTASTGTDYTATNGTISFAPGETSKTITVQVLGDTIDEFDETFFFNLSDATNTTITKNQAVTTILDNDAPPSITIGDRSITETDSGAMPAAGGAIALTYTISLDAPSGKQISVKYATADGTATAATDYTATNGSITFAPGETTKTVTVQILGDTIDEFDETFFLNLSDATNATITKNQAVSTIVDNDAPPSINGNSISDLW